MSNDSLENRINELEVRLSFQDATLAELDAVVRRQQDEIDKLRAELSKLMSLKQEPGGVDASHEEPPHY